MMYSHGACLAGVPAFTPLTAHLFAASTLRCLDPPPQTALDMHDRQEHAQVDITEFVEVVKGLVAHIREKPALDKLIAALVEGQRVRSGVRGACTCTVMGGLQCQGLGMGLGMGHGQSVDYQGATFRRLHFQHSQL